MAGFNFFIRRSVWAAVGAFFATGLLAYLDTPSLSLSPERHDHISQLSTAAILHCSGPRLFWDSPENMFPRALEAYDKKGLLVGALFAELTPQQSVEASELVQHYGLPPSDLFIHKACTERVLPFVWVFYPRPYGPGFFALIWPVAQLWSHGWIEIRPALLTIFFIMLFFAIHSLFLVRDILSKGRKDWAQYIVMGIIALDSLRWAMNGQFDSVSFFFLVWGLKQFQDEKWEKSLLGLSISYFFQFRTLFWAPMIFYSLYQIIKKPQWWKRPVIYISGLLGGTSLFIMVTAFPMVQAVLLKAVSNPIFLSGVVEWPTFAAYFVCLGFVLFLAYREKLWLVGVSLIWMTLMFLDMPYFKSMHALFVTPMMLLPFLCLKKSPSPWVLRSLLVFYIFVGGTLFISNPFDFNFFRELVLAFQNRS